MRWSPGVYWLWAMSTWSSMTAGYTDKGRLTANCRLIYSASRQECQHSFSMLVSLTAGWVTSVTFSMLDLRLQGCGFEFWSGRHQVITTCIDDCVQTGKPSSYITNTQDNSAFHPFEVGKSSTGLSGWGWGVAAARGARRWPVSGGR